MFSKVEIAGIALSVTAMAVALYLVTAQVSPATTVTLAPSASSQTGAVYVADEGDATANLRDAIVSAADTQGKLTRLIVDEVVIGTGEPVVAGDTVTVHYIGTLQNGQEFDNSNKRGEAYSFTVGAGKVIAGLEEGLVGMKVGGKRILVIPAAMAYGKDGFGPIPGDANLVYAVDLLEISK